MASRKEAPDPRAGKAAGGPERPREKNRPVKQFRLGRIRASIWKNHSEETGDWFSVTFSRTFKGQDGSLKNAQSYGIDDLFTLAEVARKAGLWIFAERQGEHGAQAPATDAEPQQEPPDDIPF